MIYKDKSHITIDVDPEKKPGVGKIEINAESRSASVTAEGGDVVVFIPVRGGLVERSTNENATFANREKIGTVYGFAFDVEAGKTTQFRVEVDNTKELTVHYLVRCHRGEGKGYWAKGDASPPRMIIPPVPPG